MLLHLLVHTELNICHFLLRMSANFKTVWWFFTSLGKPKFDIISFLPEYFIWGLMPYLCTVQQPSTVRLGPKFKKFYAKSTVFNFISHFLTTKFPTLCKKSVFSLTRNSNLFLLWWIMSRHTDTLMTKVVVIPLIKQDQYDKRRSLSFPHAETLQTHC